MEQAFEDQRVPYFDGFVGVRRPFLEAQAMEEGDHLPARWARLWKLHGSINWRHDERGVFRAESFTSDPGALPVIYPSELKYEQSRKMPYLAMIDRLKGFLRRPNAILVVVGFSFSDQHLNEVLVSSLAGNPTGVVFALQFLGLGDYGHLFAESRRRHNLLAFARDQAIAGTREGSWTSDAVGGPRRGMTAVKDPAGNDHFEFTLGDFNELAGFLADLVGPRRPAVDAA
jgi:hypothetical protein